LLHWDLKSHLVDFLACISLFLATVNWLGYLKHPEKEGYFDGVTVKASNKSPVTLIL